MVSNPTEIHNEIVHLEQEIARFEKLAAEHPVPPPPAVSVPKFPGITAAAREREITMAKAEVKRLENEPSPNVEQIKAAKAKLAEAEKAGPSAAQLKEIVSAKAEVARLEKADPQDAVAIADAKKRLADLEARYQGTPGDWPTDEAERVEREAREAAAAKEQDAQEIQRMLQSARDRLAAEKKKLEG